MKGNLERKFINVAGRQKWPSNTIVSTKYQNTHQARRWGPWLIHLHVPDHNIKHWLKNVFQTKLKELFWKSKLEAKINLIIYVPLLFQKCSK